jgi:hypothetical protein
MDPYDHNAASFLTKGLVSLMNRLVFVKCTYSTFRMIPTILSLYNKYVFVSPGFARQIMPILI